MDVPEIYLLYLKTEVVIREAGRLMPLHLAEFVGCSGTHVITAWNPGDDRPTPAENKAADVRLYDQLVALGLEPHRVVGSDPDSQHAEESWGVTGLSDGEARDLGAAYGQEAIFRITDQEQTVLACTAEWELSRQFTRG
jgi:hypothetical protein